MNDLRTVLYIDCTKLGVISQIEVNMIGELAESVLFRNPARTEAHLVGLIPKNKIHFLGRELFSCMMADDGDVDRMMIMMMMMMMMIDDR